MILAKQIKLLLKEKDLTVAQLSRSCKVSQKTLHEWISGRSPRNLNHVKSVADYLGVTLDFLIFGLENKKDPNTIETLNEYVSIGKYEVVLRKLKE